MRLALVRVVLAATSMVALAFVVPLALVAKQIAYDRALSDARHTAVAAVVAITATDDRASLTAALDASPGDTDRLAVHLPQQPTIGSGRATPADIALVTTESAVVDASDGVAYLQPTEIAGEGTGVIEVYIPRSELWRGVAAAWLAMGGLAIVLVAASIVLADRLGMRLVGAARELARGARSLGDHDLATRIVPSGPRELANAGEAFNAMAGRLAELVTAERERAADLSHRLRTPLTALRLDADALPPGDEAARIQVAVDALDAEIDDIISSARRPVGVTTTEPTDLVGVLAARLAFWTVLADHQERTWDVRGSEEPIWLDIPHDDLTAAIDALVGNVFRHTTPGTPFIVTVTRDALVVEDGGPGIVDAEAALTRGVSGANSTGLGLDIVQWVAARAGGTVALGRSALGGARVRVGLRRVVHLDRPAVRRRRAGSAAP